MEFPSADFDKWLTTEPEPFCGSPAGDDCEHPRVFVERDEDGACVVCACCGEVVG